LANAVLDLMSGGLRGKRQPVQAARHFVIYARVMIANPSLLKAMSSTEFSTLYDAARYSAFASTTNCAASRLVTTAVYRASERACQS